MEEDHINGDPAKLKKGKGNMMRDAKGRFCKKDNKVDWGSEKRCSKHKCARKCRTDKGSDADFEKKLHVANLLDEVEEIMSSIPENMRNPEESLIAIDGVIAAFTKMREACLGMIELDKSKKQKCKKRCRKESGGLPQEILDLAREFNIPVEDIISCGTVDLDTGEGTCYHRKR